MSRNDPSPALLWKPCPFLSVAVSGVGLYLQQHEQVPQRTLTHSTQASKSNSSASSLQISRVTFPVVTASQLSWQSFSTAAGSRSLLTLGFLSLSRIHKHHQKEKDRQRSLLPATSVPLLLVQNTASQGVSDHVALSLKAIVHPHPLFMSNLTQTDFSTGLSDKGLGALMLFV